jgi:hypothetical protein
MIGNRVGAITSQNEFGFVEAWFAPTGFQPLKDVAAYFGLACGSKTMAESRKNQILILTQLIWAFRTVSPIGKADRCIEERGARGKDR